MFFFVAAPATGNDIAPRMETEGCFIDRDKVVLGSIIRIKMAAAVATIVPKKLFHPRPLLARFIKAPESAGLVVKGTDRLQEHPYRRVADIRF